METISITRFHKRNLTVENGQINILQLKATFKHKKRKINETEFSTFLLIYYMWLRRQFCFNKAKQLYTNQT